MGVKKSFLASIMILIFLFLSCSAYAATIYGSVYDAELNRVDNAVVSIDSRPAQTFVAKNGSYELFVTKGDYVLRAEYSDEMSIEENVSIEDDGRYSIDLIMMPDISDSPFLENDILNETFDENRYQTPQFNYLLIISIAAAFFILIMIVIYLSVRLKKSRKDKEEEKVLEKKEKEEGVEDFRDDIIRIIRKSGGRATQKDIRKELPFSEAKISLAIAELEHKGIVEKIKKGRGNIIILNKK
ncbi:MAG: hypothetical protein NT001_06660 [Candidatus Woesearchaeota archaeon]|nr:hypothetical protein [Candidatus Woesearchaeota archaeon]